MDPLQVFISYTAHNKKLAGELKQQLERDFGFKVFVAHDDIIVGQDWITEIISALETCDLIIPILTKDFHKSVFTNQEIGYASVVIQAKGYEAIREKAINSLLLALISCNSFTKMRVLTRLLELVVLKTEKHFELLRKAFQNKKISKDAQMIPAFKHSISEKYGVKLD